MAFLLQELTRFVLLDIGAMRQLPLSRSTAGWLDLSGVAVPATWLYWAAHLWLILFLWRSRGLRGPARTTEWALFGALTFGVVAVHALVLGPLREWNIAPWLL